MKSALLAACAALALSTPAFAETFAVTHARVLTAGPAGEIADGTVVVKDGKIVSVGKGPAPAGAKVIDAAGAVVTPGFFVTDTGLGLTEISAVGDDLSASNASVSAAFDVQYGLNPNSILLPVARVAGMTSAVVVPYAAGTNDGDADEGDEMTSGGGLEGAPAHGLFAGQAAVITLAQGTDILTKAKVAMVVPFGESGAKLGGGARGAEFVAFKAALDDVRAYARNKAAYDRGESRELALSKADMEALIPVIQGRMPVLAQVHRAADILAVLKLAREENIKVILSGAEEGWMVAGEIAKAGVPVVMYPLADRPETFDTLNATMENAAKLTAAGVPLAFTYDGVGHRARETRYNAGNAVAHGVPYDKALAAVTINPARMFGVADRKGSLEPGKDADLVIWSGDPFEPLTQAKAVFIEGVAQPMTSRQLELRDRYKDLNRPLPPAYTH